MYDRYATNQIKARNANNCRLVPETYVYVGGMHLIDRAARSLDKASYICLRFILPAPIPQYDRIRFQDLAAFVEGAEHGVVLFSFGIQFDYKILPSSVLHAILEALQRLEQRVVARLPVAGMGRTAAVCRSFRDQLSNTKASLSLKPKTFELLYF